MRIPRRNFNLVFSLTIALLMSLAMSALMTVVSVGFTAAFFGQWMKGFGLSLLVSVPVAIFGIPALRRLLERLIDE